MSSVIFGAIGGCIACNDKYKEKKATVTTTGATRKQPRPAANREGGATTSNKPSTKPSAAANGSTSGGNLGGTKPQMDPKEAAAKAAEERYQKAAQNQSQSKQKLKEHQLRPKSEKALAS